jgi:hypothetical protein
MMFKTIIHGLEDGSGALPLPGEILDSLNLQVGDEFPIIETDDGRHSKASSPRQPPTADERRSRHYGQI